MVSLRRLWPRRRPAQPASATSSAASAAPAEPLAFRGVNVELGGKHILHDVSLSVGAGETVAILGPSGAGKTTLFRLALGFLRPVTGEVWVAGHEISRMDERELLRVRGEVGIVFQDGALFTSMSVAENVAFPLSEEPSARRDLHERVLRVLAAVGMEEFADRMPDELSGGQAQRVAVARAIIAEPRVMLYDEPTQGLDPQRALDVTEQIKRLSATGVSSMVVTHQLEYARQYAQRIVLLQGGRIRYDGPVGGLRSLDDPFVRSYFHVLGQEAS